MNDAEAKINELYKQIYDIRKNCGKQRQQIYFSDFEALDKNLRECLQQTHPYEISFPQKKSLGTQVQNYGQGGKGLPAKIPPEGYLYRIANPIDVFTNIKAGNFPNAKIPRLAANLWNRLNNLSQDGRKWLELSEHGDKPYAACSRISWWTHYDLDDSNTNIIEKANKLGLFENWVDTEIYLLRCKADICVQSSIASVPTIIDAYASSVFYTTENDKNPVEGITINLSQAPDLELGISEVVLKEINLNCLQIKPIRIESGERQVRTHIGSKNLAMLETLKSYYISIS
jgi:hypothetical protein